MANESEHRIMTIDQLARFLQMGKRTVHGMLLAGTIPGKKVGKMWRFDRERIIAWLNDQDPAAPAQSAPPAGTLRQRAILVVEDDPIELEALSLSLRMELPRARVLTASDGLAALVEIGRIAPSLVIADITMPRLDGVDLCNLLKRDPELSKICLVGVSGTPASELGLNPDGSPFDLYIKKPVTARAILDRVREIAPGRPCESLFRRHPGGGRRRKSLSPVH